MAQVKGGGHSSNPGFSSTEGVQIAIARFSEVTYDAAAGTATVGAGLIWDDVYAALAPLGVNVVGGRVTGVGVAGFTLGGGASLGPLSLSCGGEPPRVPLCGCVRVLRAGAAVW